MQSDLLLVVHEREREKKNKKITEPNDERVPEEYRDM
jgi:hypothetical protein